MSIDDDKRDRSSAGYLQRDIGRLEGKVDSLLTSTQNLLTGMIRADAERDNLARDITLNEQKAQQALTQLRLDYGSLEKAVSDLKTKVYWLGGLAASGGASLGVGSTKLLQAVFGIHGG